MVHLFPRVRQGQNRVTIMSVRRGASGTTRAVPLGAILLRLPIVEIMFATHKRIPILALWIAGVIAGTQFAPMEKLQRVVQTTVVPLYSLVLEAPMYVILMYVLRAVSGTPRVALLGV